MDELADSSDIAIDPAALRNRLAEAGYLFFRGLLPPGTVRAAGSVVLARLRDGGWTGADGTASAWPRALNSADGLSDPAFRSALSCAEFNQLPYRLSGLAVRPGGHHWPPQPPRPLTGSEPGWATTGYQPGDVIIFHCLTPHAALPNTGAALRISGDFRWQVPGHPAPSELVLGPAGHGREVFSRLFHDRPWWEPVPAGLELRQRAELAARPPGPSRFFAVHPGWQAWQPPPPAVH